MFHSQHFPTFLQPPTGFTLFLHVSRTMPRIRWRWPSPCPSVSSTTSKTSQAWRISPSTCCCQGLGPAMPCRPETSVSEVTSRAIHMIYGRYMEYTHIYIWNIWKWNISVPSHFFGTFLLNASTSMLTMLVCERKISAIAKNDILHRQQYWRYHIIHRIHQYPSDNFM